MPRTRKQLEFKRPFHRVIADILHRLDGPFLLRSRCYFGGGTSLSLLLGEFRESRDIDFLCSDREGFRSLREAVRLDSLGSIARGDLALAREVRAERDGIRTFIAIGETRIKLEIILEARLDLSGDMDTRLGVPVLHRDCLVAEKLLANSDRGLDDSTYARDLVDLAFLAASETRATLDEGLKRAEGAYGAAVRAGLARSLERLTRRRGRIAECARILGVEDRETLKKGLAVLQRL